MTNDNHDEIHEAEVHEPEVEQDPSAEHDSTQSGRDIVRIVDILPKELPILPVWPRPYFPGLPVPLIINDKDDLQTIDAVMKGDQTLGLLLVRDGEEDRKVENLYRIGVAAKVLRILHQNEDSVHMLVQCLERFTVEKMRDSPQGFIATVDYHHSTEFSGNQELKAYALAIISTLKELVKLNPIHGEALKMFLDRHAMDDPGRLADFSINLTTASSEELQKVLETFDVRARIDLVLELLNKEVQLGRLQVKIHKQIEERISGQQREFFLKEQLKAIKKELGLEKEGKTSEIEKFQERLKDLTLPEEAASVIEDEMEKLSLIEPSSPEYNIGRTYLDWLTILPWGRYSKDSYSLIRARRVLNRDHFGLEDVKERILEFIAVGKMRGNITGSILCLVGPPGVGKTSIGKSIASAINREFFRFSLGGMRDEAEIKGHRRTYIGAMPGKFLQAMKAVGTANPVIMLDEIDKIGSSFRGDPASALLEVLDPEQNSSFRDHYLDVPFDLSSVLFVATANQLDTIPGPLRDRMEVIRLSGYILEEKLEIARRYLVPKTMKETGIPKGKVVIRKPAMTHLIDGYAREAGVRNLENQIKKIARKCALKFATSKTKPTKVEITPNQLSDYLGQPTFTPESTEDSTPGTVTGLAWTSMGGATLTIEATAVYTKTKGFKQTGQLGEVMKESSEIAYSYVMARLAEFGAKPGFFSSHFVHLHVPAGATPKDGPSAGITMATALISMIAKEPIKEGIAMTGELTLTGKVLPIGGVKEKIIAARRVDRKILIFPEANHKDVLELPDYLKEGLQLHFVDHYDQVYEVCFGRKPGKPEEKLKKKRSKKDKR